MLLPPDLATDVAARRHALPGAAAAVRGKQRVSATAEAMTSLSGILLLERHHFEKLRCHYAL